MAEEINKGETKSTTEEQATPETKPADKFKDELNSLTAAIKKVENSALKYGLVGFKFADQIATNSSNQSPQTSSPGPQVETHYGISFKTSPYDQFKQQMDQNLADLLQEKGQLSVDNGSAPFSKEIDKLLRETHLSFQESNTTLAASDLTEKFKPVFDKFKEGIDQDIKLVAEKKEKIKKALDEQMAALQDMHVKQLNWIRAKIEEKGQGERLNALFLNQVVMHKNQKWGNIYELADAAPQNNLLKSLYGSYENNVAGRNVQEYTPGRTYVSPIGTELFLVKDKDDLFTVRAVRTLGVIDKMKKACEEAILEGNATFSGMAKAAFGVMKSEVKSFFNSQFETYKVAKIEEMVLLMKLGCSILSMGDLSKHYTKGDASEMVDKQKAWLSAALNMQFDIFVKDKLDDSDRDPKGSSKYKNQYVLTVNEDKDGKSSLVSKKFALHYFDDKGKLHTLNADSDELKKAIDTNSKFNPKFAFKETDDKHSNKLDVTFEQIKKIERLILDHHKEKGAAAMLVFKDGQPIGMQNQAAFKISPEVHSMLDQQQMSGLISGGERKKEKEIMDYINRLYGVRQYQLEQIHKNEETGKDQVMPGIINSGEIGRDDEHPEIMSSADESIDEAPQISEEEQKKIAAEAVIEGESPGVTTSQQKGEDEHAVIEEGGKDQGQSSDEDNSNLPSPGSNMKR